MTDEEKGRLNEIKADVLSLILANDSQNSVGRNIAKIVTEWEPNWCQWKDEKAAGFEKPPSLIAKQKIITNLSRETPNFKASDFARRREIKRQTKDN